MERRTGRSNRQGQKSGRRHSGERGGRAIGEDRNDAEERNRLLRLVVDAGEKILQRERRGLAKVVWGLGRKLLTHHIDADRVTIFFGEQRNINQFSLLG